MLVAMSLAAPYGVNENNISKNRRSFETTSDSPTLKFAVSAGDGTYIEGLDLSGIESY